MKFVKDGKSDTGFRLSQKLQFLDLNMRIQKIIFDFDVTNPFYDTHPKEVVNRAEFDVFTPGSFGGV